MRAVLLVTLLALMGSSWAASFTGRAGPPLRPAAATPAEVNDDSKYDHIRAEVRPKRLEGSVQLAPHHPIEKTLQPLASHQLVIDGNHQQQHQAELPVVLEPSPQHVQVENVADQHKQPEHHYVQLEINQERPAARPQHVELEIKQTEHKPQHVDVDIVGDLHKQPEHHYVQLEINQERPAARPQYIELEIKPTEHRPQHVDVEIVGDLHKQPEHHYMELEINQERPAARPQHVEVEIKPTEHRPQHVDVDIVADLDKQQTQHQIELDIVSNPRPYHVELELKQQQPAVKPHHVEVQLVHKPQPFQNHSLQEYVQLTV